MQILVNLAHAQTNFQAAIVQYEQLGNLLPLCREIAGARDILQKFENLKKNKTSEISTYDFAFL
jgi:hypothetical protein